MGSVSYVTEDPKKMMQKIPKNVENWEIGNWRKRQCYQMLQRSDENIAKHIHPKNIENV